MTVSLSTDLGADSGSENEYILSCIQTKKVEKALGWKPIVRKMTLNRVLLCYRFETWYFPYHYPYLPL